MVKLKRKVGVVRASKELLQRARGDPIMLQWAATPDFYQCWWSRGRGAAPEGRILPVKSRGDATHGS